MAIVMNEVMKRVNRIFLLRRAAVPLVFLLAAVVMVLSTVSVSHVIANMPAVFDLKAVVAFFASAFAHTQMIVQLALVAGSAFLLWTIKGLIEFVRIQTVDIPVPKAGF
ncbi:MAG TPA: hypothetical protein VIR98_02025 [Candidatus Paceibacterota bacterium]|jgi:hypothetical protein